MCRATCAIARVAEEERFVEGHGFSRAVNAQYKTGFSPCGLSEVFLSA